MTTGMFILLFVVFVVGAIYIQHLLTEVGKLKHKLNDLDTRFNSFLTDVMEESRATMDKLLASIGREP